MKEVATHQRSSPREQEGEAKPQYLKYQGLGCLNPKGRASHATKASERGCWLSQTGSSGSFATFLMGASMSTRLSKNLL